MSCDEWTPRIVFLNKEREAFGSMIKSHYNLLAQRVINFLLIATLGLGFNQYC